MTSSKVMCTSTSPETGAHADRDRVRRSRWSESETTKEFHDRLRGKVREELGRDAGPTAGVIDSQSVKADAVVGSDGRGFDGGKLINGRKRHVVADAGGLLLGVMMTAADTGDRAAARLLLAQVADEQHCLAGEPYSSHLGGKLCELRFELGDCDY